MSALTITDLAYRVGSKTLLQPTSLAFARRELTAVLGPNGAGKSTLLKAMLGLIEATGTVEIGAESAQAMTATKRAKKLAYLPQGQAHAWPLAVEDVVALGRYPHNDQDGDVVEAVLARTGLVGLRHQSVLTLSGGEQMRVGLARALAVEANYVLADEPLASLDPRYQFEIMDILAQEAQQGRGVVLVLHDLALAARYADRIVLLQDGAVLADGAPEKVLTQPLVSQAFQVACADTTLVGRTGTITVALPVGAA